MKIDAIDPARPAELEVREVIAAHLNADDRGTTSLRHVTNRVVDENVYPPESVVVFARYPRRQPQRDRDLGQTLLTGARPAVARELRLKLGPSARAAMAGAHAAKVFLQWFRVRGSPTMNDHGTQGRLGVFDRVNSPELDDFLEGETFQSIRVDHGVLPIGLKAGLHLRFQFPELPMEPNSGYAFLLGFDEPGEDRSMSLANSYFGTYAPDPQNPLIGHGIRREGMPGFDGGRFLVSPGTLGFPDVCTFRDLWFILLG